MTYSYNPFTGNFDKTTIPEFNWTTPQNLKTITTNYTLQSGDAGSLLILSSINPLIISVPPSINSGFLIGQKVDTIRVETGTVECSSVIGVELGATPGYNFRSIYSSVSFVLLDNNKWVAIGDLDF